MLFRNPICVAAGPLGFGAEFTDWQHCGAFFTQTLTEESSQGNLRERLFEAPAGIINNVGLDNPGLDAFIETILPSLKQKGCPIVVSILATNDVNKTVRMARKLNGLVDGLELNLSCPNTSNKHSFLFKAVKSTVNKVLWNVDLPIIVKLSYRDNIVELASAAFYGGATAVSAINSIPVLNGGLSGPAIRPIALKCVSDIKQSVDIPIIGIGGITRYSDAQEFFKAGATAIAVGSALLVDKNCISKIKRDYDESLSR